MIEGSLSQWNQPEEKETDHDGEMMTGDNQGVFHQMTSVTSATELAIGKYHFILIIFVFF